jgi:hypothetical protein
VSLARGGVAAGTLHRRSLLISQMVMGNDMVFDFDMVRQWVDGVHVAAAG